MKLHVSLRAPMSFALLLVWLLLVAVTLLVSWGATIVLTGPAALLGVVGGAMQAAALRGNRDAFRSAQTAMEVRRAFRAHVWGKRYLVYFWIVQLAFFGYTAWTASHGAAAAAVVLVSLYSGFALAREALTLRALDALEGH